MDGTDGAGGGVGTGRLPDVVAKAWGLAPARGRGPRPGLSLERIVESAIGVARSEGLGAVSMSRVASRLGASTMSLYRYVTAKNDLLMLMVDAAWGQPPGRTDPQEGWRAGLERWAWTQRERLHQHQWILGVPIGAPPATPNMLAWMEDGLDAMRDTALTEPEKLSTILLVSGFVRNEVSLSASLEAAMVADSTSREVTMNYGEVLAQVTDPSAFPAIHRLLADGFLGEPDPPEAEFVFGLSRIIDGVEVLIRQRETAAAQA